MAIRFFLGINIYKEAFSKSTSEHCGQGPVTKFVPPKRPPKITVQWAEISNTKNTQETCRKKEFKLCRSETHQFSAPYSRPEKHFR